jgi:hypothetical protein
VQDYDFMCRHRILCKARIAKPSCDRPSKNCSQSSRPSSEFALSEFLSKGCSSQELRFLLWKVVEKERLVVPVGS